MFLAILYLNNHVPIINIPCLTTDRFLADHVFVCTFINKRLCIFSDVGTFLLKMIGILRTMLEKVLVTRFPLSHHILGTISWVLLNDST